MSNDTSEFKKLGYVRSNKEIPMCNIFNRTPFFVPLRKKDYNVVVNKDNAIKFKNKTYEFTLYGCKLNLTIDYPMLALIIKHWVNNMQTDNKAVTVKINLSEVTDLLKKITLVVAKAIMIILNLVLNAYRKLKYL